MINYTIPHRLPRLNEYIRAERGNRYAAAKIKREATRLCWAYTSTVKIDYPIEVTCVWQVARLSNDPDNVSFGAKFILDALQKRGLKNDNLKYIKKLTHEFVRNSTESVEVRIKRRKNKMAYVGEDWKKMTGGIFYVKYSEKYQRYYCTNGAIISGPFYETEAKAQEYCERINKKNAPKKGEQASLF